MKIRKFAVSLMLALPAAQIHAQSPHPMSAEEFLTLDRVAEPAISPDGKWVAYTFTSTDLGKNRRQQDLYLVSAAGGDSRKVSTDSLGGRSAKWSPDGKTIAYINSRGGTPQLWLLTVADNSRRPLTSLSTGADGVIWSPAGTHLAFVSEVYPSCADDACNTRKADEDAKQSSKARAYDELLFRHWTAWEDGLRSHLFLVPVAGGTPKDLMRGKDYDAPVPPFGGSADYAFSPDGREIAFTAKPGTDDSWTTNSDIFTVPITGGEPVNVTAAMKGGEQTPAYSPDGKLLGFLSQARAGFESDRWRLMVRDRQTGATRELPKGYDQSIGEYAWLAGGDLVAVVEDRQRHEILHITPQGDVHHVFRDDNLNPGQMSVGRDGQTAVMTFVADDMARPADVYTWRVDQLRPGPPVVVTRLNTAAVSRLGMRPAEEVKWKGADGDTVYGLLLKPPQFQEGRKYPLVLLVHGGPQGAWLDGFHSRWNAQLFAAPGNVVFLPNPRGSTGFGQKFLDQISRDWGGRVVTDIMTGVDMVAKLPYVDSTRMAAAGGSYGGYMMNWFEGHTNRFKTLVNHAGVFNLEAMYGSTEELWFIEWEFGGAFWANRGDYEKWSPHRFAAQFKTPMLVIHGEQDFRVPYTEGLQAFTAVRRQGVPSRLVMFPDEGHWISRPQNQLRWWGEVQGWLGKYLSPPTP